MATRTGEVLLAEGELSWPRGERVGDRYGLVTIQTGGHQVTDADFEPGGTMFGGPEEAARAAREDTYADFAGAPTGLVGTLVAEVVATRDSYHIGDLFHGFRPETPEVGERVKLGRGVLFVEDAYQEGGKWRVGVGVRPTQVGPDESWLVEPREYEGRKLGPGEFWMDPRALYRCHSQTVRLYFVPGASAVR